MEKIATATYSFEKFRRAGYVYVDKTDLLWRLVSETEDSQFFIARPRRFGKSLMLSTLRCIFEGRHELFKGLKIDKLDYDWKKYPVVHLDMTDVSGETPDELKDGLFDSRMDRQRFDDRMIVAMRRALGVGDTESISRLSARLSDASKQTDVRLVVAEISRCFSKLPFEFSLATEDSARRHFRLFMEMLGAKVAAEEGSAFGYADAIIETKKFVWVFEFKFNKSAKAAVRKIREKGYAAQYKGDKRPVTLVGINFRTAKRNIDEPVFVNFAVKKGLT